MANNRIAYGLAKEYGIDTKGMSPKEVWDALAGKGINFDNYQQYQNRQNDNYDKISRPTKLRQGDEVKIQYYSSYDEFLVPSEEDNFNINENAIYEQGEINGIKKEKVMSFSEADSNKVNPKLFEHDDYSINCQSCVGVFEARLRGYDLEVLPFDDESKKFNELADNPEKMYIGGQYEKLKLEIVDVYGNDRAITLKKALSLKINEGERYNLTFKFVNDDSTIDGHVVTAYKNNGKTCIYDPQNNNIYTDNEIDNVIGEDCFDYKILRVDNLPFNKEYISAISKRRENEPKTN